MRSLNAWSQKRTSFHQQEAAGASSVVGALDSWLKGHGFKSQQMWPDNLFLHVQLSVPTLILVSIPPLCYRSSMQKIPIVLPKVQVAGLQLNAPAPYICGFAWSDVTRHMVVWHTQVLRWQPFYVAPDVTTKCPVCTPLWRIFETFHKKLQSLTRNHMRQECSESARQRRIALHKSDHQNKQANSKFARHSNNQWCSHADVQINWNADHSPLPDFKHVAPSRLFLSFWYRRMHL